MIYDTFVSVSKFDTSSAEDALLARNIQRLQYLVHSRDSLEDARWVGIGASFVVSHDTSMEETGTLVYLMMRDLEVEAATGVSLALYQAARLMYPHRPVVELLRMYAADVPGLQRDTDAFGLDGMLESVDID